MTKILCDMTGCKYNKSCCLSSENLEQCYCTKEKVHFKVDEEIMQLECDSFTETFDKEVECRQCQISKYGGIRLKDRKITFEENPTDKFDF